MSRHQSHEPGNGPGRDRERSRERGSASVEAAVGVPAFLLLIGLILLAARVTVMSQAVQAVAADAFRRLGHSTADPALIGLCKRCLAKDPAKRPANGKMVAAELAEIRASAVERLWGGSDAANATEPSGTAEVEPG